MVWHPVASLERLAMESVRWAFSFASWVPCREDWLLAMRLVQPEEKERIGQFVFARDAKAAMAGRLLIRKSIAEKLNIPWNAVRLERSSKGKPVLVKEISANHSPFNFNVSHQGNYTVLAAEPDRQVGIDIMKTALPGSGSIPDFFRIMKRQFTEEEWRTISSMCNEWLQLDMFHRHWATERDQGFNNQSRIGEEEFYEHRHKAAIAGLSHLLFRGSGRRFGEALKESFIKAIGVGIGFDLQRIEFNVSPVEMEVGKTYNETIMLLDGEEEKDWTFEETRLDGYHHVAVALGKPERFEEKHAEVPCRNVTQTAFTMLDFDDLVASAVPLSPEDPACWDNFCSRQDSPKLQSSNSRKDC